MSKDYLFTSERLGFRNWMDDDFPELAALCADKEVMEHFPYALSLEQTRDLISRLKKQYNDFGYTYFAVDVLETGEFIGFIGLAYQEYDSVFSPATDIGWRLKKIAWNKGYATEGARRCLAFAFAELGLEKVVAVCTVNNKASERVMIKIGMERRGTFDHSELVDYPDHRHCIWYSVDNEGNG